MYRACVMRTTTKAPLYTPDKRQVFQLFHDSAGAIHKSRSGQPLQPFRRHTEARFRWCTAGALLTSDQPRISEYDPNLELACGAAQASAHASSGSTWMPASLALSRMPEYRTPPERRLLMPRIAVSREPHTVWLGAFSPRAFFHAEKLA